MAALEEKSRRRFDELKKSMNRISTPPPLFICILAMLTLMFHVSPVSAQEGTKEIVAGFPANFPPQYTVDKTTGEPVGFALDVMDKIAERSGIKVRYVPYPKWPDAVAAIKGGDIDIIPNLGIVEKRKEYADFTLPVEVFPIVIFVRSSTTDIQNLDDLTGKKVGVVVLNKGLHIMKKRGHSDLIIYDTPEEALMGLFSGQCDALVYPGPTIMAMAFDAGLEERIKIVGEPVHEVKRGIAVAKGNSELVATFNKAIQNFVGTPEYMEIYTKWYGRSEPYWNVRLVATVMGVLLAFIVILLGGWHYLSTLKSNKKLTALIKELKQAEEGLLKKTHDLNERVKEIDCLYSISKFTERPEASLDEIIQGVTDLIPPAWQFPEITCGRIILEDKEYTTEAFKETKWKQSSKIVVHGERVGSVEVYYLEERPESDEGPFLKEEKELISAITERLGRVIELKQIQEELREREERLRAIFEAAENVAFIITDATDPEPLLIEFSPGAEKIFGYKRSEVIGNPVSILHLPEDFTRFPEIHAQMRKGKDGFSGETTLIRKSGEKFPALFSTYPLFYEKDEMYAVLGVSIDISEQKRLEDQLQKARKMEVMGLMAGGIAHDLNNILSGIATYPELLLMDLPEDSPLIKPIKIMQESGMKATDVVADLLTIARGVATGKEALNLNIIVTEYLGSAEHEKLQKTHSFIDFTTELDPDLLNLSGSPIHIKKILMNLVNNASEAIEEVGTVTISTANRYLDEPLKGYEDVRIGEYAVLTVSDDGSGISSQDLESIFEPFYTKKVMGKSGTGLGLAIVWNAVQDHNGYIDVKSSEKGTVFELYFPVTREKVADEKEQVSLKEYRGHGEKILVVDDEERQREIATGMLTRLGYNAEAVSSGEEAVLYVKENPVDLIVLDMVMPKGINGRKTYEEIVKIRPKQKAIIASGYAKTKEVDLAQALGAGKYIKKPYTLEKVGLAVKEELQK